MNCELCGKEDAQGLIRTKNVCNKCFKLIKIDNEDRQKLCKTIPEDFTILKKTMGRIERDYSQTHIYRKITWSVEKE